MLKTAALAGSLVLITALATALQDPRPKPRVDSLPGTPQAPAVEQPKAPEKPKLEPVKHVTLRARNVFKCLPSDVTLLKDLGTLETMGYKRMVVNVLGQSKAPLPTAGELGVILVPDTPETLSAMRRYLKYIGSHFIRAKHLAGPMTNFASPQLDLAVGFPRYRVFAYNSTDRTADLVLHAYLTVP